jgi:oligosaccharide repeat unit polymerase
LSGTDGLGSRVQALLRVGDDPSVIRAPKIDSEHATNRRTQYRVFLCITPLLVGVAIGVQPSPAQLAFLAWSAAALLQVVVLPKDRFSSSAASPTLIVFGLAAIYGVIVPLSLLRTQKTILLGIDYSEQLSSASAMCALATASFSFGYLLPQRRRRQPRIVLPLVDDTKVRSRIDALAKKLAVGAALLFLYRVARYGLGGWSIRLGQDRTIQEGATAYITYAPQYLAGLCLYLWSTSPRPRTRWLAGSVTSLVTFYFFAAGVRYLVIVTIGAMALLYYWRRFGRLLPPLRYLIVAGLIGFLVLGYGGQLRGRSSGGRSGLTESAADSFEISLPLAGLISYTQDTGYIMGASYTYLAYQVIPRSIWPGKPFPPTYTAIASYTDIREGRSFPLWGELFLNFGWYGVIGGMAAFGYMMRRWLRYWRSHRARYSTLDVIAAITLSLIVQWVSRGLFVQLVYNTVGLLVGPLMLLAYERRGRKRLSAEANVAVPRTSDLQTMLL